MADEPSPSSPPTNTPKPDDGLTVRERRALHHKSQAPKLATAKVARKAFVPVLVVLILAGVATGFYFESKSGDDCPGHWHAAYATYVNGTRLTYPQTAAHAEAYGNGFPQDHSHHIHNDGSLYHFHPGVERCISTEAMFDRLDVDVRSSSLEVGPSHGAFAGTYREDAAQNLTLQVWYKPANGEWRETSWSAMDGRQLPNFSAILVTYGVLDDATLAAQQAQLDGVINDLRQVGAGD